MKANKKVFAVLSGLAICSVLALFGSTAGTLAWYAYNRTVFLGYTGTSVRKSVLLHIGLVDDDGYLDGLTEEQMEEYGLTRENEDGHKIVWTTRASGFSADAIKEYLSHSGHAISMLSPVTSGSRSISSTSALSLYQPPEVGDVFYTEGEHSASSYLNAHDDDYVELPFAFKVISDDQKVADQDVWLTDAVVQTDTTNGKYLNEAVRVFVDKGTSAGDRFIMAPNDRTTGVKETTIGGLLDLDGLGTYDYDLISKKEYIYGEFNYADREWDADPYGLDFNDPAAEYDNVNHLEDKFLQPSTFYAKHHEEAHVADLTNITFLTAEYYPFGEVRPNVRPNGDFYHGTNGVPIAHTAASGELIGYTTLTIYIEGWDHALVDKVEGCEFNLGLQFEVNRL